MSAFYPAISTGEKTSSETVKTGNGYLTSVLVITDGTNAATVIAYDNTSAAGKKLGEWTVAGATGYGGRNWTFPVAFATALHIAISGTGASAIIEYV